MMWRCALRVRQAPGKGLWETGVSRGIGLARLCIDSLIVPVSCGIEAVDCSSALECTR